MGCQPVIPAFLFLLLLALVYLPARVSTGVLARFNIVWMESISWISVCSSFEKNRKDGRYIPNECYLLFSRFADFVEGSFHLTPNEVSVHEQEYGLGSIIAQDELYEETSSEEGDTDSRYPAITQQNNFLT